MAMVVTRTIIKAITVAHQTIEVTVVASIIAIQMMVMSLEVEVGNLEEEVNIEVEGIEMVVMRSIEAEEEAVIESFLTVKATIIMHQLNGAEAEEEAINVATEIMMIKKIAKTNIVEDIASPAFKSTSVVQEVVLVAISSNVEGSNKRMTILAFNKMRAHFSEIISMMKITTNNMDKMKINQRKQVEVSFVKIKFNNN